MSAAAATTATAAIDAAMALGRANQRLEAQTCGATAASRFAAGAAAVVGTVSGPVSRSLIVRTQYPSARRMSDEVFARPSRPNEAKSVAEFG
jgi:hypothetical protein